MPPATKAVGPFPLAHKTILVTGGGTGINLSFASLALAQSARILIADLRLSPAAEALISSSNGNIVFHKTNVTDFAALRALPQVCVAAFGDVPDIWVAGAGVFEPPGKGFWEDDEQDGFLQVRVNVEHPIKLSRIALRECLGRGKKGVVCILGSGACFSSSFAAPLYVATKHAVSGFVKSVKGLDEGEGVKIVSVCPGIVDTPLWTPELRAQWDLRSEDLLTADDVAKEMVSVIEQERYPGGTQLEVLRLKEGVATRVVPDWNIEPPAVSIHYQRISGDAQAMDRVRAPILNGLDKERKNM